MKNLKLVNLTPHAITLRSEEGADTVLPPSGTIARVASTPGRPFTVIGLPVPIYSAPTWGDVTGIPESVEDTYYIVSSLVAARVVGRTDVLAPGTGPSDGPVRNEAGQIVAVTRLVRLS